MLHFAPFSPNMAYKKRFLTSANRTVKTNPICLNPCKASGFLVHSQFLYVFVHSFTWCHECWSPGHKEQGADPAQWLYGDVFRTEHTAKQFLHSSLACCDPAAPSSQTMQPFPFNPGSIRSWGDTVLQHHFPLTLAQSGAAALGWCHCTADKWPQTRQGVSTCSVPWFYCSASEWVGILFFSPCSTTYMKLFQSLFQNK